MLAPSDHLLRTFASVPLRSRVLDLGCGRGRHTEPLVRLGFDLYACDLDPEVVEAARARLSEILEPEAARQRITVVARESALGFPDAFFDWVVLYETLSLVEGHDAMLDILREVRRVLKPGGWVYVAVHGLQPVNPNDAVAGYASDSSPRFSFTPGTLNELLDRAHFALAEAPQFEEAAPDPHLHAIYRRVEADTPL